MRAAFFGKKDEEVEFFYCWEKKSHESSMAFLIIYLFHPKWGNKILKTYYPLRCNTNTSSSGIMVKIGGGGHFYQSSFQLTFRFHMKLIFFQKQPTNLSFCEKRWNFFMKPRWIGDKNNITVRGLKKKVKFHKKPWNFTT